MAADEQQPKSLHFFLLPFPAPSHTRAMLHMAVLFARHGAKCTVVTTSSGAARILSANIIDPSEPLISVALLSLPDEYHALTAGLDDVADFPTPIVPDSFISALETLRSPFELLLRSRRPDCVIADYYMHWSADSASLLGIPRLAFGGIGMFFHTALQSLAQYLASSPKEEDRFILPDLPHRIEMHRSYIPSFFLDSPRYIEKITTANDKSHGIVVNSFFELEPDYAVLPNGKRCWLVGPLFMKSKPNYAWDDDIRAWLDTKANGSVVYVCFGSLGRFTPAQTREIAAALRSLKRPFIWVIREEQEESLPEKFKEEVEGMVVARWVPQTMILNHRAVGAFVSHCGWNSTIEAISAGVPIVAWPLFVDQPFNAAEVVEVMGTGAAVEGVRCSMREEERGLVGSEVIARAVERVMEEGEAVKRKARGMKEKAMRASEEGGSSYQEVRRLFTEISELKEQREGSSDPKNCSVGV